MIHFRLLVTNRRRYDEHRREESQKYHPKNTRAYLSFHVNDFDFIHLSIMNTEVMHSVTFSITDDLFIILLGVLLGITLGAVT